MERRGRGRQLGRSLASNVGDEKWDQNCFNSLQENVDDLSRLEVLENFEEA